MTGFQKLAALGLCASASILSAGENLWYNSSFELGLEGWDDGKICYHYPHDPNMPAVRQLREVADAPHGKNVLQIRFDKRIYSLNNVLGGTDVQLVPGKKYTVSFYVKPEVNCTISCSVHSNHNEVWHSASGYHSSNLQGGKWQRVHYTFVYQPKQKFLDDLYHTTYFLLLTQLNGKSMQFDAMQLEEGELTPYKPAAPVEYALTTPSLYLTKPEMTAVMTAVSYDKAVKSTKELILKDSGKNCELAKKTVNFDLVPGKIARQQVSFGKLPYGGFKLYARGEHKAVALDFVRVRTNPEVYQKGKFALGMRSAALGIYSTPWNRGIDMTWQSSYTCDEGELVRLTGATVVNPYDACFGCLGALLPEKRGQYDWTRHDLIFNRARELNLKVLTGIASQSLMARGRNLNWGKLVPDWLRKLDRFGKPEGSYQGGWSHVNIILPPPEVIGEIAAAICKRYEKDLCMFRLFAEANGYMKATQLLEYSKAVYTETKKPAPGVLLNTFNATEDGGSVTGGYFEQFLKAGGGKYTDAVSFHPYRCSQDDSAVSAMEGIQAFYKVMKSYNQTFPLAQTECYYLIPDPYNGAPEYTWKVYEPAAIARRILIDLGEGTFLSNSIEIAHLHTAKSAHDQSSSGYFTMVPKPHFAVHNAMGHFVNNADQPERVMLPGNELCYKFRKGGKLYSAVWRITGKSDMILDLPAGVSCKVYDIYGNMLREARGKLKLELNREPAILEWSKGADPVKLHKTADYVPRRQMEFYGLKLAKDGILVMVCNRSGKPLSGKLRIASEYIKGGKVKIDNVAPHSMTSILVPAELKANAPEKFSVNVVLVVNGKVEQTRLDLAPVPVVRIKPQGFSFRVQDHAVVLKKEGGKLKISVDFASTKMRIPANPANTWDGDCVELYVDCAPKAFKPADLNRYNGKCYQLILGATKDGAIAIDSRQLAVKCACPAGVSATAKLTPGKGAKIEAEIPWIDGMGFNVSFNAGGKWCAWRGTNNFKQRNHFVVLTTDK